MTLRMAEYRARELLKAFWFRVYKVLTPLDRSFPYMTWAPHLTSPPVVQSTCVAHRTWGGKAACWCICRATSGNHQATSGMPRERVSLSVGCIFRGTPLRSSRFRDKFTVAKINIHHCITSTENKYVCGYKYKYIYIYIFIHIWYM